MSTPTQRSLAHLRAQDYYCAIVERWNAHTKVRQDLFGFADLLCIKAGEQPLLVQVTASGWASRIQKILAEPRALLCLQSGFRIQVHGWRKLKSNKNRMTIKVIEVTPNEFSNLSIGGRDE